MKFRIFLMTALATTMSTGIAVADQSSPIPGSSPITEAELHRQIAELTEVVRKGPPQFSLVGTLRARSGSMWEMNGLQFTVTDKTEIYGGELRSGAAAEVIGSMENGKPTYARKILIRESARSDDRHAEQASSNHEGGAEFR